MPDLRERLIRLAHTNPGLRPHLLPILAARRLKPGDLSEGDIVRHTREFLRNTGFYTNVPIDGLVVGIVDSGGAFIGWPKVHWHNADDPDGVVVNPVNLELVRKARVASSGIRLRDLPAVETLMDDFRRISKVWSSEVDAEEALRRVLERNGLREAYRDAGPHRKQDVSWQQWHLVTDAGEPVQDHINVFHRPGPRPGWTSFQVSM